MTQLTFDLARALAKGWGPGDEVVVTRLDHDANIRPWVQRRRAPSARPCAGSTSTGTPPSWPVDPGDAAPERTRLVAVTGASNLLGTRPDLAAVADAVHAAGALLLRRRRAPHAARAGRRRATWAPTSTPARPTSSSARTSACWWPTPTLLEQLHPDKLLPSTDAVPERFELGTLPYELLAGVTAAVDFIADLAPGAAVDRRSRVVESMTALERYEDGLFERLLDGAATPSTGCTAARPPAAAYADGAVLGRRAHRPRGVRARSRRAA